MASRVTSAEPTIAVVGVLSKIEEEYFTATLFGLMIFSNDCYILGRYELVWHMQHAAGLCLRTLESSDKSGHPYAISNFAPAHTGYEYLRDD